MQNQNWSSITSSADGKYISAAVNGGDIWVSSTSGATWADASSTGYDWVSVTSSADGKYMAAVVNQSDDNGVYMSSDHGTTWTHVPGTSDYYSWTSVRFSPDGSKLIAAVSGGDIFILSVDGASWKNQSSAGSRNWSALASSVDGSKVAAIDNGGDIWTGAIANEPNTFDGGNGTLSDPYKISTCIQLQNIGDNEMYLTSNFIVTQNIDCSATSISDTSDPRYDASLYNADDKGVGHGFIPISSFSGTFDGQGHTISDLYEKTGSGSMAGLFSEIDYATVANIGLINENIIGNGDDSDYGDWNWGYATGGLVGYSNNSEILKSFTTGSIGNVFNYGDQDSPSYSGGQNVGGLVGFSTNSHIENTYSTADVQGLREVGGLIGEDSVSDNPFPTQSVVDSYATGDVTGTQRVGGLIGYLDGDPVSNSFSMGKVTSLQGYEGDNGGSNDYYGIGGLIGYVSNNEGYNNNVFNSGWYRRSDQPAFAIGCIQGEDSDCDSTTTNVTYSIFSSSTDPDFINGDQNWFYDQTRSIYATTSNSEPIWDFSGSVWQAHSDKNPDFTADPVVITPVTPITPIVPVRTVISSSQSGTTIPARVANLLAMGDKKDAEALMQQWPQYFPNGNQASSTIQSSSTTQVASSSKLFLNNMAMGYKGTDVARLQAFLNANGFIVNKSGAGSIGHETTVFGSATKNALIKFQEAHSDAILKPSGLKKGTGNFYNATRTFVNATLSK
jgi:hypothetical protein